MASKILSYVPDIESLEDLYCFRRSFIPSMSGIRLAVLMVRSLLTCVKCHKEQLSQLTSTPTPKSFDVWLMDAFKQHLESIVSHFRVFQVRKSESMSGRGLSIIRHSIRADCFRCNDLASPSCSALLLLRAGTNLHSLCDMELFIGYNVLHNGVASKH
jgi:hypothetical protein